MITDTTIQWTSELKRAYALMQSEYPVVMITGAAGTGKSTLLGQFRSGTSKRCVVLAPTGIASIQVKGETIHSFLKLRPGMTVSDVRDKASRVRKRNVYEAIDVIIIDEISMVRADLLDMMNVFLQTVRRDMRPFGGIQMIMIGDFAQLPPVVSREEAFHFTQKYKSPFVFSSDLFLQSSFDYTHFKLTEVFRQTDADFVSLLNRIREGDINQSLLNELNRRVNPSGGEGDGVVVLSTTNSKAETANTSKLNRLMGTSRTFTATTTGQCTDRLAPAPEILVLKEGAQIIFLVNDPMGRFVNGTIGRVIGFATDCIIVEVPSRGVIQVTRHEWKMFHYDVDSASDELIQKEVGSFTQYPLKLSWAITIHKSQSQTFDRIHIDFGSGTFAQGQAYVALSRCRTLEGLTLARPVKPSDFTHPSQLPFGCRNGEQF